MTTKTRDRGWAIPDDWDGQTWSCIELQWPDSPKYTLLLRSLLYSLTRGRDWDRDTGNIKQQQLIGWEIFTRNSPLVNCEDCPECPPEATERDLSGLACGGLIVMEDDDVGQVVTDVTVEDGVLTVWFGPCCSKPLSDFVVSDVQPGIGDTPWQPPGVEEAPDYSACGKAAAIVEAIYFVLEATQDALVDTDYPWQILGHVENSVGYNLDNKWLAALWGSWLVLAGLSTIDMFSGFDISDFVGFAPADVFSPIDRANSRCALEHLFSDNAVGVPDETAYNGIKATITSRNLLYGGMISLAISTLGRANLDAIAKLGAANTGADCQCYAPGFGEDVDTIGLDWFMLIDFRTMQPPAGSTYDSQHACPTPGDAWVSGLGLSACPSMYGRAQTGVSIPVLNDGGLGASEIVKVGVRFKTHAGDEWKLTPGYRYVGFDNGLLVIEPTLVDTVPISSGGTFDFWGATAPDSIAGATEFKVRIDFDPLATGYVQDDPTTGNVIEQVWLGGTGEAPILWPE